MFLIVWEPEAFNQMGALIRFYPDRKDELALSLQILARDLDHENEHWGESRDEGIRIGFPGILSVLIDVDSNERVIRISEIKLR